MSAVHIHIQTFKGNPTKHRTFLKIPNALFALLNFGDIVFLCNIPLGIASKQTTQKIFGKEGGK